MAECQVDLLNILELLAECQVDLLNILGLLAECQVDLLNADKSIDEILNAKEFIGVDTGVFKRNWTSGFQDIIINVKIMENIG